MIPVITVLSLYGDVCEDATPATNIDMTIARILLSIVVHLFALLCFNQWLYPDTLALMRTCPTRN